MLGYRKFMIVLYVHTLTTLVLLMGRIDGAQYVEATIWTSGAYIVGNVGSKFAQKFQITATPVTEEKK
jgi:hypothetical protein